MWIFSRAGMFSVVSDGIGGMQIRARNPEHFRRLQSAVRDIADEKIHESTSGDYCCRLLVSVRQWRIVADFLADDATKYRNFKAELETEHPDDSSLHDWAYMVWLGGCDTRKKSEKIIRISHNSLLTEPNSLV